METAMMQVFYNNGQSCPRFTLDAPAHSELDQDYYHFYGIDFENKYAGLKHYFGINEVLQFNIATHYFSLPQASGSLLILHGYYDHMGLYQTAIDYGLSRQLSVFGFDLPGHGLSDGEPASIQTFSHYTQILTELLNRYYNHFPKPCYVIAQSTGAAVMMDYLLQQNDKMFAEIIFFAPLVRVTNWNFVKWAYRSCHRFLKKVPRNYSPGSHDQQFTDFVKYEDPLQCGFTSVAWVGAMLAWEKQFYTFPATVQSPVIIQGKEDTTVDWRHNIKAIQEKFFQVPVHYIAQGKHRLVNESRPIWLEVTKTMDQYF